MSDLISRSQLLKEIKKYKFGAIFNDAEREYIKKTILDFIICQPTAYSVDKVVEELEEYLINYGVPKKSRIHQRIIAIVKQGGVSDDLCEWKLEDEEANLYLTGCQQRQLIFEGTPKENGYIYCPYCSKKIKVVE